MAQVILLKDVPQLGQKGTIKEVKDGYFRNFLMPEGLAELATHRKIKELEETRKVREKELEEIKAQAVQELKKIGEGGLVLEAGANEKGHLFKGIRREEIAAKLQIPTQWVLLEKPIKELGEYVLEIKAPPSDDVHDRRTLKLTVKAAAS